MTTAGTPISHLRRILARVSGTFTGFRADADAREELETHLELQVAENVRRGMSPDAARRQALLASGGVTLGVEAVRDQRGLPWLETLAADLKYASRSLRHSPAFSIVAVITLALGIGANTAIFSVVRGVLLKPLPHRDGDRLLYLRHSADGPGMANLSFSVPEVRDFRAGVPSLRGIAEYSSSQAILQEGDAVRMQVGLVTGNFFEVMGLTTVLGRVTRPTDDGPSAPSVMVLTHDFWMKRFAGDSTVVGRHVRMNGSSVTVIGVLEPAPWFPEQMDALLNMAFSPHHVSAYMIHQRAHRMTEVVARLAPGASVATARAEVTAVYGRLQREYTDAYDPKLHYRVEVIPFKKVLGERAQLTVWLLMGAAAFVLIIAAANVANLTLMRGVRRAPELAARAALGAGVARLRRLLLTENLLLTFAGAALGVIIAIGGVGALAPLMARYSPRASEIRLDAVVLVFAFGVAFLLAVLLSFTASLPKENVLAAMMGATGRRVSGSRGKQRLRGALVVAQVAVSVVLLAGAGLLTRTLIRLSNISTGLETEEVLTMEVPLLLTAPQVRDTLADLDAKARYERMRAEIAALPGVVTVGVGFPMPLQRYSMSLNEFKAEGKPVAPGRPMPSAELRVASPEFFRAAGIPLRRGRAFESTDQSGPSRVVIVNQMLADMLFPGEDPIGKRIAARDMMLSGPTSDEWRTIVGVVGTTQDGGLDATRRAAAFVPFAERTARVAGLVIRVNNNAKALIPTATRIVRRIAPGALIEHVMTVAQIKDQSVAPRRLNAVLVSSFGVLAVLIAAVGIAGVLSFAVSTRTNEIGIRMSLGADRALVQWMILREGGVLVAVGLAVGTAGALATSNVLRGFLFGVAPHDPVTFAGVATLMAAIGIVACWIPALRASRIDPAIAMRAEQ